MTNRKLIAAAIAGLAMQAATPAIADDGWDVILTPYFWAIGIDGDIQARGHDVETSMDFADVLDNLDMGAEGMFEFSKGHWANFVQVDYLSLDTGDVDTRIPNVDGEVEMDTTIALFATGYRFNTGTRSTIDVMAGVRYTGMDATVSIQGLGERDGNSDLYDGVLVLRPRFNFAEGWYFSPTMSIGGGDSDLTWELSPQIMYGCPDSSWEFRFGYRDLNYDFDDGEAQMDLSIHGPMIGAGFRF